MIQKKDKVTHPAHGVGIVENLYNNESVAAVDFKGIMRRCEVSNLQKGGNTYIEPTSNGVLLEVRKLQEKYIKERDELYSLESLPTQKLYRLIHLKENINDLEIIIQGKK